MKVGVGRIYQKRGSGRAPASLPERISELGLKLNSVGKFLMPIADDQLRSGLDFTDSEEMEGWIDPLLSLGFEPATIRRKEIPAP